MGRTTIFATALAFLAGTAPAAAHHGWGGYDSSKTVSLTGTVQSIAYSNPHAALKLEAGGKVWDIVLAPITRMSSRGLPDGAVKAGQTVTVEGYVSRSEPAELRAETITVDGKSVPLR